MIFSPKGEIDIAPGGVLQGAPLENSFSHSVFRRGRKDGRLGSILLTTPSSQINEETIWRRRDNTRLDCLPLGRRTWSIRRLSCGNSQTNLVRVSQRTDRYGHELQWSLFARKHLQAENTSVTEFDPPKHASLGIQKLELQAPLQDPAFEVDWEQTEIRP